jgi:hypothetical protein
VNAGTGSLWLFLCLGLAGAALPAHFGFRVLAWRHHLDRGHPLPPGSDDGGWGYSWWLMRFGHRALRDRNLDFFAATAGLSGWLALIGVVGTVTLITL